MNRSPGGRPVRRRLARRAGAGAALLLALLLATPASPAGAEPTLTIIDPKDKQVLDKATFTVRVSAPADLVYRAKEITWAVGGKTGKVACPNVDCTASWTVELPSNGPKELTVSATTEGLIGLLPGPNVQASPRAFALAAPAAQPVLDPPKVNDARNTELSWSRNAEPDLLYYAVFRKDPGGTKYTQVGGKVTQPATGTKVTYTDTTTSAFLGGEYSYQVVAVRRGATATAEVSSAPSTARTATIPAPPTTTSTSVVPGAPQPGAPAAGPTTTVKPGTTAGVDLSGFLSSRSQPAPVPTITVPEPPDTGFAGTLPFGARPADLEEEGEADAVLPDDERSFTSIISRISPGRPLVPVAGGLILLLLAMHMRLLNHRIKAEPAGDLPIDDVATPPAPAPPPPAPAMPPVPAPAPAAAPPAPSPPPPPPSPRNDVAAEWADFDLDDLDEVDEPEEEWAPVNLLEHDPEPDPQPDFDPDAIEVFEVVSSNRKRLARAGAR
jgi:hypothetical protein